MNDPLAEFIFWMMILFLWWFFHWPQRGYQVDRARHHLFVLRRKLFEAAADGSHIQFEDRAYTRTREMLDAMSHHAKNIGVLEVLIMWYYTRRNQQWQTAVSHQMDEVEREIRMLSPEGQEIVHGFMRDAVYILMRCMMWSSLLGVLAGIILYVSRIMGRILRLSQSAREIPKSVESAINYDITSRNILHFQR